MRPTLVTLRRHCCLAAQLEQTKSTQQPEKWGQRPREAATTTTTVVVVPVAGTLGSLATPSEVPASERLLLWAHQRAKTPPQ